MKEQAILVDTTYCTGCNSCTYKCIQEFREHDLAARGFFRTFVQITDDGMVKKQCMSCKDPQCVKASPGAFTKSAYGPVLVNAAQVKNEKDAVGACPFHALQYDDKTNQVINCNMCAHRLTAGQKPACVEACPSGALQSGDYEAMAAKAKQRAADKKLKIYGLNENGGTHVIILTKADPVALGYPKVATRHLANLELPLAAGALYLGFKTFSDRREAVEKAEKEQTK